MRTCFHPDAVGKSRWQRLTLAGLCFAGSLAVSPAGAQPVQGPLAEVTYEAGDTIRSVAEEYLNDPDLWPQILELSGIASTADLEPGSVLRIPVEQVAAADGALATSLEAIQRATAEGARIFASLEIEAAIEHREAAVERRGAGDWSGVVALARSAIENAELALRLSLEQRDRAAEAIVSDVQGEVEGRTPKEPNWSPRATEDILVEYERVRTLSDSTAQVTFRDLSRLRLNENSNAVIQRMRTDPLTGGDLTEVSLLGGDFYALLNQLGDRTTFSVDVPGIETETKSADFWISHDEDASRFANYDVAALDITRQGQTISLGENEGAVIDTASGAAERATVLRETELVAPAPEARFFSAAAELEWRGPEDAEAYWLEVAADADFNTMRTSEWGLRTSSLRLDDLAPGEYHWRVSALDSLGLPGKRSLSRRFSVLVDDTPPFLTVLAPREGEILSDPTVTIAGETESGATLDIDGRYLAASETGRFTQTITAAAGANSVRITAVDAAGNMSERTRSFVYRPGTSLEIEFDDKVPHDAEGRFLTRADALDVHARVPADEGSPVRVLDGAGAIVVNTAVGAEGAVVLAVPASAEGADYVVEVLAPDGSVEGSAAFTAVADPVPPELVLDLPPPGATALQWMELSGAAGDAVALTVNGTAGGLVGGRFVAGVGLSPGPNAIEIVATDAVGNVAVKRFDIVFDDQPPEILSATLQRSEGVLEVLVEAADASGLRQASSYRLSIDGIERQGFLRCDASGNCRDTLPAGSGEVRLIQVQVSDYAGNVATRKLE